MPYSFTKIEKDKTKTIGFVFFFLILFYFVSLWVITTVVKTFIGIQMQMQETTFHFSFLSLPQILIILGSAMIVGYVHWNYTTSNLIIKILGVLKAEKLTPNDIYHQMFENIVEEVSVATGGRKLEGVVIPTSAMNAFAVADFSGRAVIGVTEGMLARLTRAQLEAVVGHEAAHIVSGDCLATTVTTSLFELYSGLLRGFEAVFRGGRRGYNVHIRGGGGGGAAIIILSLLIYALLWITKLLSQLVRLFISRQREYRADAIAVRLTRDPLSLAEVLYAIAYRWRGGGLPAQELESIFIVNPMYAAIDEESGLFAEMFSTHPPMSGRLDVLLDMAHTDAELLIKEVERKWQRARTIVPEADATSIQWMINKEGDWKGPYNLMQMATLGWMHPETWIQRVGGSNVQMAYEDQDINRLVNKNTGGVQSGSGLCPKCRLPLNLVTYEGTEIQKCWSCRGTLVRENDIQRIIIRHEVGFSDKVKRIAEGIQKEDKSGVFKVINRDPKTLLTCPKCQQSHAKMMRMFYTEAYHVEIDKCFKCGLIWFDTDELEVLQHLIESVAEKV